MPKETGICKLVFMEDGKPRKCGGRIERKRVAHPFATHTPGPPEPPLFSYEQCNRCHGVYNLGAHA